MSAIEAGNTEPLVDNEGENQAVRCFLMVYRGAAGLTVGSVKEHLSNCGFPFWPTWVDDPLQAQSHLTKAGAQLWIRYLFTLESPPAKGLD